MAAGKTSVGRALAAATGRRFVDLDERIAAMGEPVAALVARDEPEFRRREAAAIVEVAGEAEASVVATGGGAAAFGDNLERMRAAGFVVALGVDPAESARRAASDTSAIRPLLASGAEKLAAARAPSYRRAHSVVDTMGKSVDDVVAQVRAVERVWEALPLGERGATILALGERSYPVTVSPSFPAGTLTRLLEGTTKIGIVTDAHVAPHHLELAAASLGIHGARTEVVVIPPGEASKSFAQFERLTGELIGRGLDRGSALVALGGGVVGDLTGFVAATLFRGIPVIQMPTTIVAMTDAAIGGKTAIDTPAGKNLVGAFWQPRLVACATDTLATLPARERRAGFGELWKYALLDGEALWDSVAACAAWAAGPDGTPPPPALRSVIDRSIAYKAAIVGRDERELTGHRALLNLGHTVGHAIEAASGMLHGEAVALGLVAAARVSAALVGTPPALATELTAVLAATGLPSDLDPYLSDEILARVAVDKKRMGTQLKFICVRGVGSCEVLEIPVTEIRRILRSSSVR